MKRLRKQVVTGLISAIMLSSTVTTPATTMPHIKNASTGISFLVGHSYNKSHKKHVKKHRKKHRKSYCSKRSCKYKYKRKHSHRRHHH